jgi:hypothetical protein
MAAAARVKGMSALRTLRPAVHVLADRQFQPARAAQNRFLVHIPLLPDGGGVIRRFFMAQITRIIGAAARKLDGYDIDRREIMRTTRFAIESDTLYFHTVNIHLSNPLIPNITDQRTEKKIILTETFFHPQVSNMAGLRKQETIPTRKGYT